MELIEQAEKWGLDTEFFRKSTSSPHSNYFMLQIMKDEKCKSIVEQITESLAQDVDAKSKLYDVHQLTTQLRKFYEDLK